MQLAEDEGIVPLVDRLLVLKLRFQEPNPLVERSRNFDGYISASRSAYISRGHLAYRRSSFCYTAKAFISDIGHLLE
jgi:hypothetical protein